MQSSRKSSIPLLALLCLAVLLDIIVAFNASVTTDEPHHVEYGRRILQGQPDHFIYGLSDSQMPISALNALPGMLADQLQRRHVLLRAAAVLERFKIARIPTLIATLALDTLVYFWALDLYGYGAAIAACLLCILSPNLMAHGTLATTDMYHALGVVAAMFFFRRFLLQPTLPRAIIGALVLALAQVTKAFALVLYPVVAIGLLVAIFRRTPAHPLSWKRALTFVSMAVICFLAVINVAYSFENSFLPLRSYHFETALFNRVQKAPILDRAPVPGPSAFLQGLDMMKHSEETGRTFGDVYLLGQIGDPTNPDFHGFRSYYAVAIFYKEPIALGILFVLGLVWIVRHRTLTQFLEAEGLLLIPTTILVLWLSFSRTQIGIRHILPFVAVESIVAGAAFYEFRAKPRLQKALLCGLATWVAFSVARYYPQMIPYMNEWVRDPRLAYRVLSDSNLDWGQDLAIVNEYLRKHPDVVLDPPKPQAGRILVRANRLTGVYRWDSAGYLAKRYEPVAQVGYAHFLFEVPAEDVASGKLHP